MLHAILTITSIGVAFTRGMARFDNPTPPQGYLEWVCSFLASIFVQPSGKILTALGITLQTSAMEWIVLLLNSMLWGATIALLLGLLGSKKKVDAGVAPQ